MPNYPAIDNDKNLRSRFFLTMNNIPQGCIRGSEHIPREVNWIPISYFEGLLNYVGHISIFLFYADQTESLERQQSRRIRRLGADLFVQGHSRRFAVELPLYKS